MAQTKRKSLGRGLSALIPPKPAPNESSGLSGAGLQSLPIEEVLPGDGQPRQMFEDEALAELANSIVRHGVLQPIVVRRRSTGYEIVAGERRWRAAQKAGLHEIPAVVSDIAEEDTLTVALVENVQRQDLNAIEEAEAYHRLHDSLGYSQADIAEAVGKDRATIANSMRLLKLPASVRQMVLDNELSMGHARALLGLEETRAIEKASREAAAKNWSVRQTEQKVRARKKSNESPTLVPQPAAVQDEMHEVRVRLQRALGAKVDLKLSVKGKGSVVVHFASRDELNSIIEKVGA